MTRSNKNRGGGQKSGQAKASEKNGGMDNLRGNQSGNQRSKPDSQARKRQRHSTGGRSTPENEPITADQFKSLSTDDKLVTMFGLLTSVHSMNERLDNCEENVATLLNETSDANTRIKVLEYHSIDNEARSRRLNLIFRGLPEKKDENCFDLVRNFIQDDLDLGIETADSIVMQRAHRIGARAPDKIRPVIACFTKEADVKTILGNANKLKGKPQYGVNRDYPNEIVQARSRLWSLYKTERGRNPPRTVFISYPAKLIVKGSVIQDEFPDWDLFMRKQRVPTKTPPKQQPVTTSNPFSALADLNESPNESGSGSDSGSSDGENDMNSRDTSQPVPVTRATTQNARGERTNTT